MPIHKARTTFSLIAALALLSACGAESGSGDARESATEVASETASIDTSQVDVESSAFPVAALIDPNSAAEDVLAAVPGMTEAAVAAIVAGRPFATPGEMDTAIGDSLDEAGRKLVYALVFVKVGLNSGAEDDYKLIPSTMSPRKLAHEFEEYRPYDSMDQFSREMSKYVSDEEVVYLGRFVTLD